MKKNGNSDQENKIGTDLQKETEIKKRRFPKFGVLDAVIILLAIVIVAGVYFRYNLFDKLNNAKNLKECFISFKTDEITTAISRELEKDDRIYFKNDGKTLGTLTVPSEEISVVIQEQPATHTVFKDGKTYPDVQYPQGMEDSLIYGTGTIRSDCSVSEDGTFLLNGSLYLAPGQRYTVCTEKVTLTITITDIEVAD